MRELEPLIEPANPSPGPAGLATPLLGLIVFVAMIVRALSPRPRPEEPEE